MIDSFYSGKANTPGIYTRVGAYNDFIRSTISLARSRYYYYYSSALQLHSNVMTLSIFMIVYFLV